MNRKFRALTLSSIALTILVAGMAAMRQDGSGSAPSGTTRPAAAQSAKVMALSFYADWCPGCKALAPKLEQLMTSAATQPCLFIKLDQTDRSSHQAEYMVAALGLADLWKEHAGKTGYTLLIDTKSKKVIGTLTADQDLRAMQTTLASALK